jgi:hypothetical protein
VAVADAAERVPVVAGEALEFCVNATLCRDTSIAIRQVGCLVSSDRDFDDRVKAGRY